MQGEFTDEDGERMARTALAVIFLALSAASLVCWGLWALACAYLAGTLG